MRQRKDDTSPKTGATVERFANSTLNSMITDRSIGRAISIQPVNATSVSQNQNTMPSQVSQSFTEIKPRKDRERELRLERKSSNADAYSVSIFRQSIEQYKFQFPRVAQTPNEEKKHFMRERAVMKVPSLRVIMSNCIRTKTGMQMISTG